VSERFRFREERLRHYTTAIRSGQHRMLDVGEAWLSFIGARARLDSASLWCHGPKREANARIGYGGCHCPQPISPPLACVHGMQQLAGRRCWRRKRTRCSPAAAPSLHCCPRLREGGASEIDPPWTPTSTRDATTTLRCSWSSSSAAASQSPSSAPPLSSPASPRCP
jgi:hypothetical protein